MNPSLIKRRAESIEAPQMVVSSLPVIWVFLKFIPIKKLCESTELQRNKFPYLSKASAYIFKWFI